MRRQPLLEKVTLSTRTSSRLSPRALALLDVLIGMAIFALIAVIAVIAVGQFRHRAYVTGAISDARSLGLSIESAATQDGAFPSTVAADGTGDRAVTATVAAVAKKLGVITPGNRVGGYAYLPATAEDGSGFRICVEHVENGNVADPSAVADAHAIYDSVAGGVIVSGDGDCDPAMAALPGASTDDGDGDGDGDGDDPAVLGIPQNVTAVAVPNQPRANVTWDAVVGATSYAVFLDDATTPAWTGPEVTTLLTGLSGGDHHVTVTARAGSTESGPSEPADFTIFCDNNALRCAHPVTVAAPEQAWTSADYDNSTADGETGEPVPSRKSLWWTMTAPRDATYTFRIVDPTTGTAPTLPTIRVWNSTATDVTALTGNIGDAYDQFAFEGHEGETYKIRVIDSCGCTGHYGPMRLRLHTGATNDMLHDAHPVEMPATSSSWTSSVVDTTWAGGQAGEPVPSSRSLWWTYTPDRNSAVNLSVVGPTTNTLPFTQAKMKVWRTTSTDVTALGTPVFDDFNPGVFDGVAGQTYKIQVYDPCRCNAGYYGQMRLKVDTGPPNDNLNTAMEITGLSPSVAWQSPNVDNTYAGAQVGEPTANRNSTWWTLTVPRDATYTLTGIAPTDGPALSGFGIKGWRTTTTDVTALGTAAFSGLHSLAFDGQAGETYKIQIIDPCGCAQYKGKFRLQVTPGPANDSLINAEVVPAVAAGATWYGADMTTADAGTQRGESAGRKSAWWTFTPTRTGSYSFRPVAPSTGGAMFQMPQVQAWATSTTDVTALGTMLVGNYDAITFTATAGQTYKVRVQDPCGCAGWSGPMRMRVTG